MCGRGGIGRLDGFRFHCLYGVRVRVPPPAPCRVFITDLSYEHSTFCFSWSAVRLGGVFLSLGNRFCRTVLRFGLLRQVLDGDALTGIDSVVFLLKKSVLEVRFAQVDIAHEAVVDHDALGAVLPLALCLIDVDVVDQLLERCGEGSSP